MDSLPPYFNTGIFNSSAFYTQQDYLTKEEADKLYLSINTSGNFAALSGVTAGIVSASKAVIVDANRDITNFNNLTATNLTATSGLSIVNATTPLLLSNTTSSSIFRCTIQNSGGHQDIGSYSNHDVSLNANNTRRLTINANTGAISNVVSILASDNLSVTRSTNGECFVANNGTSRAAIHCLTNSSHIGTTTNTIFNLQSNGSNCLQCLTNGDVNIINNLNIAGSLNLTKSSSATQISLICGSSNCSIYQTLNGTTYIGNNSNTDLSFQTNGIVRVNITNAGLTNIIGGWQISSTTVNSTATEINYLAGITTGTAAASKALVLDASRNLTNVGKVNFTSSDSTTTTGTTLASAFGLNILSTVNTNGQYNSSAIAFLNASADAVPHGVILSQRKSLNDGDLVFLTKSSLYSNTISETCRMLSTGALAVNATAVATISAAGGSSYTDGSYQKLLDLQSNNVSPIDFCIEVNAGASTTTTNATWIGNLTNNDLRFGTNNSTKMVLDTNGRLGINTTSPSSYLSVSGTVSNTFNVGGQLYAIGSSTAYTTSQLGPVTVSISANFGGPIQCSSIYCTSDRRVKKNISLLNENYCENLYNANVYTFDYIGSDDTIPKIGFIAQDLNKLGYINLLNLNENQNLKFEEEGDIDGAQMSIDYNKVSVINFMMIKKLLDRINKLEKFISELDIEEVPN